MATLSINGTIVHVEDSGVLYFFAGLQGEVLKFMIDESYIEIRPSCDYGPLYLISLAGENSLIHESAVVSWVKGLAIRNGVDSSIICCSSKSVREQSIQALMFGHQCRWFKYCGIGQT